MTNRLTEVISDLRGISLLILTWHSLPLEFPLDGKIKKSLAIFRNDFENILEMISQLSKNNYCLRDLHTVFNDILDDELNYYNEETLSLTLTAYYNSKRKLTYPFHNSEQFFVETTPIFFYLLNKLLAALSVTNNAGKSGNLQDELTIKLLKSISMLVPKKVINAKPNILLKNIISPKDSYSVNWLM